MGQIVSYAMNERGNFVIEVKPTEIKHNRVKTTQVAGTGWYEALNGMFAQDPEGNDVPLYASVSIRYANSNSLPSIPEKKGAVILPFR